MNTKQEQKLNRFDVTFEVVTRHKVALYAEVLDGTAEQLVEYIKRAPDQVINPASLTLAYSAKEFDMVKSVGYVDDVEDVVVTEVQEEN